MVRYCYGLGKSQSTMRKKRRAEQPTRSEEASALRKAFKSLYRSILQVEVALANLLLSFFLFSKNHLWHFFNPLPLSPVSATVMESSPLFALSMPWIRQQIMLHTSFATPRYMICLTIQRRNNNRNIWLLYGNVIYTQGNASSSGTDKERTTWSWAQRDKICCLHCLVQICSTAISHRISTT